MSANINDEDIKQNITESEKQNATGAGSVTEGDKHLVETKTVKHPLDADIRATIQFGDAFMGKSGDDAESTNAACESARYASEEECMTEDDYNGMMAMLYDEADECSERHPYFCECRRWTHE